MSYRHSCQEKEIGSLQTNLNYEREQNIRVYYYVIRVRSDNRRKNSTLGQHTLLILLIFQENQEMSNHKTFKIYIYTLTNM